MPRERECYVRKEAPHPHAWASRMKLLLWGLPLVVGIGLLSARRADRSLKVASAVSGVMALLLGLMFLVIETDLFGDGVVSRLFSGTTDGLGVVDLLLVGGTTLGVLLGFPRGELQDRGPALLLLSEAGAVGTLLSSDLLSCTFFGLLSLLPIWLDGGTSRDPALRRASLGLVVGSGVPLLLGTAGTAWWASSQGIDLPCPLDELRSAGLRQPAPFWVGIPFLLGALVRLAVAPTHSWLPVLMERGRASLIALVALSPLGAFGLVVSGVGLFPGVWSASRPWLLVLGVLSAAYGSLLALGQQNARRMLGFLGVSLGGMVLVGLSSSTLRGESGALFHAAAVALAFPGLLLCVRAIEARTGTADMRQLGGFSESHSELATGYLLLGLAVVGFPGTATFISEDLLVQGLLHEHIGIAVLLLLATALNGITLLRSFKRIFLGPPASLAARLHRQGGLLRRERLVIWGLVATLVLGGAVPMPLLAIREGMLRHFPASLATSP